jgi:hypothetical protein
MTARRALLAAALLVAGGAARAEDAHGLTALRDRTLLAAYPGPIGLVIPATAEPDAAHPDAGMPSIVRGAIGCAIGGTLGTAAAFIAGGENTINLVAGGLVPSVNRAALYVGLVGVVFGSFCALGQAVTPIITHAVIEPPAPAPRPPVVDTRHAAAEPSVPQRMAFQAGVLGTAVTGAAQRMGAAALASIAPPAAAPPVLVARQR